MFSLRSLSRRPAPLLGGLIVALALEVGCGGSGQTISEIRTLQDQGRFEASLEPLEVALARDPNDAELLYLYGLANARAGRPSLALWPLRKARESPEWAVRAGTVLARAALATDDEGTAIEAASRVLELDPDHVEMLALRAEAHARANRFDEALTDADRVLDIEPDAIEVQLVRLRCLIGLERLEEAEAAFEEFGSVWARDEIPEAFADRLCAARAKFADESEKTDLAEERFEACLEAFPTGATAIQESVAFFDRRGRPERANEILRSALERQPQAAPIRETLAARLRASGSAEQAEALLLAGTELEPGVAFQAWGGLASHYFQLGDFDSSVRAWERVLEHTEEPEPDHLFGYAEALIRAGRHDRALDVAERLPEVYAELVRGLSMLEQDRPEQALAHFAAGLRLWPNQAVARRYAAIAAERMGDFPRAISEYRQSVRTGAELSDAGLRLARLYVAEGSYEPAWQVIVLHLDAHPQDPESQIEALRIAARLERRDLLRGRLESLTWPGGRGASLVAEAAMIVAESDGPEAAVDLIRRAPGIDLASPDGAPALRALVIQLYESGRGDEGLALVENAIDAHPGSAELSEIRALLLEVSGAADSAVREEYDRVLELDPENAHALAALGRLARAARDDDGARRYFERAATANPDDAASWLSAAELTVESGDRAGAQRLLEALLRKHPYDGRAAAELAEVLLADEVEVDRARSLAERAVRFRGGPAAYAVLTEASLKVGDADPAVAILSPLARSQPGDASLQYQLGRALAAAGRPEEARAAFERALSVDSFPERSEAEAALAKLDARGIGSTEG